MKRFDPISPGAKKDLTLEFQEGAQGVSVAPRTLVKKPPGGTKLVWGWLARCWPASQQERSGKKRELVSRISLENTSRFAIFPAKLTSLDPFAHAGNGTQSRHVLLKKSLR
jgi:hypothetical protein